MVLFGLVLAGYAEQPTKKFRNTLGMGFVLVQPSQFIMGSPKEPGRYTGETQRRVLLQLVRHHTPRCQKNPLRKEVIRCEKRFDLSDVDGMESNMKS